MKKLITLLLILGMVACSEDDSMNSTMDELEGIAKSGTWRITYFWDSDQDETDHFTGYSFTFGDSDVLTATKGATTITGVWSISDSNSGDDSMDDLDFNILFTAPPDFEDLSDDWEIMDFTSTKIQLKDVSGGGGGTDFLTFEKN
ncbi:MAG: hypothetical protein OEU76_09435 [Cyclobacteriaceae bacterium]|nr:hypothetical protein [Cyclobacteriaceae bacterium]